MYDLEIITPVSVQTEYALRLDFFKKYGLLNIGDKKVLLTLLVGTASKAAVGSHWPCETRIIHSRTDCLAAKTYEAYASFEKPQARWTAKFDDDSVTDVSALVDLLDERYDHTREYYLVTELHKDMFPTERNLMKKLGYGHWFKVRKEEPFHILHEVEGSVMSHAAFQRILSDEMAMKLIKMRSTLIDNGPLHEYPNDVCLSAAAQMCKIYPVESFILARHAVVGNFTLFGGSVAHLHEMSFDKNKAAMNMFLYLHDNLMSEADRVYYEEIKGGQFLYWSESPAVINLQANGCIEEVSSNSKDINFCLWTVRNKKVIFMNCFAQFIAMFDVAQGTDLMRELEESKSLEDRGAQPDIEMYLKRI